MISSEQLNQLIADQWEAWMRWDPLFATSCGDHRFNDRLPDAGEDHYVSWRAQLDAFRLRLQKIDPGTSLQQLNGQVPESAYAARSVTQCLRLRARQGHQFRDRLDRQCRVDQQYVRTGCYSCDERDILEQVVFEFLIQTRT